MWPKKSLEVCQYDKNLEKKNPLSQQIFTRDFLHVCLLSICHMLLVRFSLLTPNMLIKMLSQISRIRYTCQDLVLNPVLTRACCAQS